MLTKFDRRDRVIGAEPRCGDCEHCMDLSVRRPGSVQRMAPPQARKAPETPIRRDEFAAMLDRERCVVGIRNVAACCLRLATQICEDFPVTEARSDDDAVRTVAQLLRG